MSLPLLRENISAFLSRQGDLHPAMLQPADSSKCHGGATSLVVISPITTFNLLCWRDVEISCSAHDNVLLNKNLKTRAVRSHIASAYYFVVDGDTSSFEFWLLRAVCLLLIFASLTCYAQHNCPNSPLLRIVKMAFVPQNNCMIKMQRALAQLTNQASRPCL